MMNKTLMTATLITLTLGVCSCAFAGTYSFSPNPSDLNGLDHNYYYSWGFQWTVPAAESITSAVLTIKNIDNWADEPGNKLFTHLLTGISKGVKTYNDTDSYNQGPAAHDNWADWNNGHNTLVGTYHDSQTGHTENLTYDFQALGLMDTLKDYATHNSVIGFGFDPDCHYNNCGITLKVTTETRNITPEPGGLAALGTGLISLVGFVMRRRSIDAN
jgi:hypothetical protein